MTVNEVLTANREKLMEILRENFVGDPKTSWGNILDNVVDWFECYCCDEASEFLNEQFETGKIDTNELLWRFEQFVIFDDINEYDVI